MASEHIVKSYDEELRKLSNTITEMGGLAESQLAAAIDAVVKRDSELAGDVVEGDAKVDLARMQENCPKVKRNSTIDAMVFNCAKREAYVTRRAGGVTPWKKFTFTG